MKSFYQNKNEEKLKNLLNSIIYSIFNTHNKNLINKKIILKTKLKILN